MSRSRKNALSHARTDFLASLGGESHGGCNGSATEALEQHPRAVEERRAANSPHHFSFSAAPLTGLGALVLNIWHELQACHSPASRRPPSVLEELAQALADRLCDAEGIRIIVRSCVNAPQGTCFARSAHSFILLERAGLPTLIVDPCFQTQFHLGRNDGVYSSFLATVPQLFVGTMAELEALVLACAVAISAAFARQQMPTPPWRQGPVMLCRWRPQRFTDTPFFPRAAHLPAPAAPSPSPPHYPHTPGPPIPPVKPPGTLSPAPIAHKPPPQHHAHKRAAHSKAGPQEPLGHAIIIGFEPQPRGLPPVVSSPSPPPPPPKTSTPFASFACAPAFEGHAANADPTAAASEAVALPAPRKQLPWALCASGAAPLLAKPTATEHKGGVVAAQDLAASAAPAKAGMGQGSATPAARPQAAKARPAFFNTHAGPVVNYFPCSEPQSSLAQSAAGLLATQSLSHTASGLLEESEKQPPQQEQAIHGERQQQQQHQHQQSQTCLAAANVGGELHKGQAGRAGQDQTSQQAPACVQQGKWDPRATAAHKQGYQELLPPIYKVRLGKG